MNPTLQLVAAIVVVPAAVSAVVLWLAGRWSRRGRYAAGGLAFVVAYWAGYLLLAWMESGYRLWPTQPWQWIPYLAVIAALGGMVAAAAQSYVVVSRLAVLTVCVVSAWLLVPAWPDLQPPRGVTTSLLAVYLFLLSSSIAALPDRLGRVVLLHFALAAATSAALIAAAVSFTYAKPAMIAAASFGGVAAMSRYCFDPRIARGLSLVYAVTVGGWAFTGAIYPRPPVAALLVAPLAPIALWVCIAGPAARWRGWKAAAFRWAVVLVVLAVAVGLVLWTIGDGGDWGV
jgi:hypothetical protein